jgi:ferredoxin
MCTLTAPDVFDQRDSDGVVVVIQPAPRGEQLAAARKAINLCPSRAIAAQA